MVRAKKIIKIESFHVFDEPHFLYFDGLMRFLCFGVGQCVKNGSFERNSLQFDDPIVKNLVDNGKF